MTAWSDRAAQTGAGERTPVSIPPGRHGGEVSAQRTLR